MHRIARNVVQSLAFLEICVLKEKSYNKYDMDGENTKHNETEKTKLRLLKTPEAMEVGSAGK